MGRTRKIFNDRTDMFFHTERTTKKQIENIADEDNKSVSQVINEALIEFIRSKKGVGLENPLNLKYAYETIKASALTLTFSEFSLDRNFTIEDARSKVRNEYMEKYNVPLHKAYSYHNNMVQVIALKMRQQQQTMMIRK